MFKAKTKVLIGNLSCSHLKEAHPNATSGNYTINPDGSRGEDPFTVFCDMSHNYEVGVTVVSHDSEGPTKLTEKSSCDTWTNELSRTLERQFQNLANWQTFPHTVSSLSNLSAWEKLVAGGNYTVTGCHVMGS